MVVKLTLEAILHSKEFFARVEELKLISLHLLDSFDPGQACGVQVP